MFVATVIVSVLLALALIASAAGKFQAKAATVDQLARVGVTRSQLPLLGGLELAGGLGLLVGLFWAPIGIAAAIGVIAYFAGAVIAHLRAHDRAIAPPAVLGLIAVAALVLRSATA